MADKPRNIIYMKTESNYMRFKNLNEFPTLNDIKYMVLMSLIHFRNQQNFKRFYEFKNDVKNILNAIEIEDNTHISLNKFMEDEKHEK